MSLNTAAQQWALMESAFPEHMSQAQRAFAKNMFYAGFSGAVHIFTDVISGESEMAAVHIVQGLIEECQSHNKSLLGARQ